jgi:hypothetical protein
MLLTIALNWSFKVLMKMLLMVLCSWQLHDTGNNERLAVPVLDLGRLECGKANGRLGSGLSLASLYLRSFARSSTYCFDRCCPHNLIGVRTYK